MDLRSFFWFCAGANAAILKRCPTEHIKYTGMGGTVFFTGLFAGISGGYALFYVFNDAPLQLRWLCSAFFGLVWGTMIFNLDRYIVASMKKTGSVWGEWKMAFPRILLAAIIAVVVSKPLELQIFHTSIHYELATMQQEELKRQENAIAQRFQPAMDSLSSENQRFTREIESQRQSRNQLDEAARAEADGTGGTQKRGAKTIYNLKKADANKAQAELDTLLASTEPKLEANRLKIKAIQAMTDSLKRHIVQSRFDGFDKQLDALGRVSATSSTIALASWFVMLLFLAIEVAPVLVKMLSPRGPYDNILEKHEHAIEIFRIEQMSKLNHKTNETLKRLSEDGR